MTRSRTTAGSPVGPLVLVADDDGALTHVLFDDALLPEVVVAAREDVGALREAVEQLEQHLAGERHVLDLPLAPAGTDFQRQVWLGLADIPYGTTRTYAEQAAALGRPTATRAVGAANGRNPLAVVLPCHRVVGSDGSLTGYAGGLERKRLLLALERRHLGRGSGPAGTQPSLFDVA